MKSITANKSTIHFNKACYKSLNQHIKYKNFSNIFILVDENTHTYCLPLVLEQLETHCTIEIIELESGEIHKTIETCLGIWNTLSDLNGDRKSLLINVGGGVITDLGGFVASTFKRGIAYINIPTTLLSMVDASVGGKTGVDLGTLKNQIGVVSVPDLVLVDTNFLKTLPQNQMRSGLAEMLKHGLISSPSYWNQFKDLATQSLDDLDALIYESILIKKQVVDADPFEANIRKTLNFGHTLGHAIESYCLSHPQKETLLHGEAIAIGIVMASYISTQLTGFSMETCLEIKQRFHSFYGVVSFDESEYVPILELMKFDKKNHHGNINFVLLEAIGTPKIDCLVEESILIDAFKFYAT
ncbi:MAG: 3-dehydroquinate synthase [Flavobacteriales bacterium]|nr:3-dehydroquinate synthase [Flavobacteriia bacterium]NCP06049.1 3-dehydroquinate synthase [Flavobacteriales bacterium]PIV93646.1 MAG: 3-dehydroquinate synthase [Flavobacteriaceae bacterium CG17_big_fil_post_rev_8_21_14_2_50_33_15]PIY09990.1 MAG: 3-dehydroquinate synthase [Flavobacteriaceae bacterium CG_4_10_14_3_um_filter_33_47]NCP53188.1 3-dehydroquinate synthase [Flavobacteriales bacterium]